MSRVPDIQKFPKEWFNFFDDDNNGVLTKSEIIRALIYTFNSHDVDYITSFVENIWPLIDKNNDGSVSYEEFSSRDGLLEAVLSSLPKSDSLQSTSTQNTSRTNSNNHTIHSSSSGTNFPAVPYPTITPNTTPTTIKIECGACTFQFNVTCPPGQTTFGAKCSMCETMNQVTVPPTNLQNNQIAHAPPAYSDIPVATAVPGIGNPPPSYAAATSLYSTGPTVYNPSIPPQPPSYSSNYSNVYASYSVPSVSSVPTRPSKRKALLIGINYFNTRAQLRGCINDTKSIKTLLQDIYGWQPNNNTDIKILTDDSSYATKPTRSNILSHMKWLVADVQKGDVLFLLFSGHGAQKPDPSGVEEDGMNECILPVDFQQAGMITDDEMASILVHPLPDGVRLTALMDCCHSGTGLDLPYEWLPQERRWREETNPFHSRGDVQMFSGCTDDGVSSDGNSSAYERPGGAMTTALCHVLRENPCPYYPELLEKLHIYLRRGGYGQKPTMSSSQAFAIDRPFLLDDILPNTNSLEKVGHRIMRKKFPPRPNQQYMQDDRLGSMLGLGLAVMGGMMIADILW